MSVIFTLVRHGETVENKERIMQGHMDTSLSATGEEQARLAGRRLAEEVYTHVYASDLKRAYNTCKFIMDVNANPSSIIEDKRLRERCFGEFEGQHVSSWDGKPYKGVESAEDLQSRGVEFLYDVLSTVTNEQIQPDSTKSNCVPLTNGHSTANIPSLLIATHGGIIRALLKYFIHYLNCEMPARCGDQSPHNASLSKFQVEFRDGEIKNIICKSANDIDHLITINKDGTKSIFGACQHLA